MAFKRLQTRSIARTALLFAVCMVLSLLENLIPPLPMLPPGVKLGLSNIAVMYCLFFINRRSAVVLILLKGLMALITRGPVAACMSLAGGFLSFSCILILFSLKKNNQSYIMISVTGAIAHNIGQIFISAVLLKTATVFYYLPVLVLSGILMGSITGISLGVLLPVLGQVDQTSFSRRVSRPIYQNKTGGREDDPC